MTRWFHLNANNMAWIDAAAVREALLAAGMRLELGYGRDVFAGEVSNGIIERIANLAYLAQIRQAARWAA